MAFRDVWEQALDEADSKGTIDLDDPGTISDFRDTFDDLMEGRDHFPSLTELSDDERDKFIDFLSEYDLWDEFRDAFEEGYKETV